MLSNALKMAAIGLCTVCAFSVQATNFNYNALELHMGTSPGTFGAEMSSYFTGNTHFIARADSQFEGDWDVAGGVGFNGPAGEFADINGQMLVHNIKKSSDDPDGNKWKTEVNIGTRVWLLQNVELAARIGQLIDNEESKTTYSVGAHFYSIPQLSFGADFKDNGTYGPQLLFSAKFIY